MPMYMDSGEGGGGQDDFSEDPAQPSGGGGSGGGGLGAGGGMGIGAAIGILSAIGGNHAYKAEMNQLAQTTRYSPWTHMQMTQPKPYSGMGTILGYTAAGGALGSQSSPSTSGAGGLMSMMG